MSPKASGSETRQRTAVLQARFTFAEATTIRLDADRAGMSVGGYLRSAVLSAEPPRAVRRPTVNQKLAVRLLGELAAWPKPFGRRLRWPISVNAMR
jgi:hypothetical protein